MDGKCRRNTPNGECGEDVVPGTEYCKSHTMAISNDLAAATQYQFDCATTADRVEHFRDHQQIYSLKASIAMNEVMLEKLMNDENNGDNDRGLTTAGLASKVAEITKVLALLKKQSLQMERETKQLYTKQQLLYILNQTVNTVAEVLRDAEVDGHEELVLDICDKLTQQVKTSAV